MRPRPVGAHGGRENIHINRQDMMAPSLVKARDPAQVIQVASIPRKHV